MKEAFSLKMRFMVCIILMLKEKLNLWGLINIAPPPPPSSSLNDSSITLEVQNTTASSPTLNATSNIVHTAPPAVSESQMMWLLLPISVIGVSLAAISATLQALAAPRPLTTTSQIVYVSLLTSFSAFLVSVYIRTRYTRMSAVALHVGSFFGSVALAVALAADLPTPLMFTCAAIVSSAALLVIFANFPIAD